MANEALYVNSPSSLKLGCRVKELFACGQNTLFLQKTLFVVLARAAPKGVDLEERIAGFSIGVFGVKSP